MPNFLRLYALRNAFDNLTKNIFVYFITYGNLLVRGGIVVLGSSIRHQQLVQETTSQSLLLLITFSCNEYASATFRQQKQLRQLRSNWLFKQQHLFLCKNNISGH